MPTNQDEFYRGLERAGKALQGKGADCPSSQAESVHNTITALIAETPQAPELACREGCSHCCHFPVGITFPEAMRMAAALTDLPDLQQRIHNNAAEAATQAWANLVGQPCPLLVEDRCSIHSCRPMPCRALGSTDELACAESLTTDRIPPRDETAWWRGLGAASALASQPPTGSRELRSCLSAILTTGEHMAKAAFIASRPVPGG
jgi:hypothetical protein